MDSAVVVGSPVQHSVRLTNVKISNACVGAHTPFLSPVSRSVAFSEAGIFYVYFGTNLFRCYINQPEL